MPLGDFHLARIPPVHFGAGKAALLPALAQSLGKRVLLVRGSNSLERSGHLAALRRGLIDLGLDLFEIPLGGEPTTAFIDKTRDEFRRYGIDVVLGIGGGSVIDAAKALSAMLPHGNSVLDHLEDVGRGIPHNGIKVPLIAVPTTSGTGGEMTKNAVLSEVGPSGYKKSLRHDNLIPDAVVIDPGLMVSCPPEVTAACGMDAFTQLLEPFLSPKATPMTDALALSGMRYLVPNLSKACGTHAGDVDIRGSVAYGAMLSGVVLANAGLGLVHGFASPLGGCFPIPHGVICGTLVAETLASTLQALRQGRGHAEALAKIAQVAAFFNPPPGLDEGGLADHLVGALRAWTRDLGLPSLSHYGVTVSDLPRIVANTANRHNPVALTGEEMTGILTRRL